MLKTTRLLHMPVSRKNNSNSQVVKYDDSDNNSKTSQY